VKKNDCSFEHLDNIRELVFGDRNQLQELKSWLSSTPSGSLTTAIGRWVIGDSKRAVELLRKFEREPQVRALLAAALISSGRPEEASELVRNPTTEDEAKAKAQAVVRLVGAKRLGMKSVEEMVADPGILGETGWVEFLRGFIAEYEQQHEAAIELYATSWRRDMSNADCTFHLARLLELHGADEEALELYEDLLERTPPSRALLTNLGLLYEDMDEYKRAESCYQAILAIDPENERALLFLRDVEAAKSMLYDEEMERREDKRNAILRTPVTDFELSVRSRNCLAKMGIRTLGDLVRKTEAELLSYKNFGETSLTEIQQILTSKGLRLGMEPDELLQVTVGSKPPAGDLNDPRNRPITELELSVRSRRVVEIFKMRTIGDLCDRTEAELMACPNFGQTSLNEIKTKLDEFGLGLKS
jgi:DNA-directed RNA polymerase subunit alpha